MKRIWLIVVLALSLAVLNLYAQEPGPAGPDPEPAPAGDKPQPPEEKPKPEEGKIVVYMDAIDSVDGKQYKWRMTEFMIAKTFELADPGNKEKWKEEQRERHDWSKFSKEKREKKIEKDYRDLRKTKGVDKLDFSHIKVLRWRPRPKKPKEDKEKKDEDKAGEDPDGGGENGKEEPAEPDESGEKPHEPGGEPARPKKPAPKTWVDPKTTADFLILGEAKFTKGKLAKYFGNTVAWNSHGELHIQVVRRLDLKVIKEFKEKLKRSHTLGQERAHQQCMQDIGQKVATAIAKLPEFKKKK